MLGALLNVWDFDVIKNGNMAQKKWG